MYVHGAALAVEIVTPDLRDYLLAGKHRADIFKQVAQQFELLEGKLNFITIDPHDMLRGVDVKPAYLVFLCFLRGSAAQQRLYAGDKLHGAEWLCNVVVGAAVKTYHLIIL